MQLVRTGPDLKLNVAVQTLLEADLPDMRTDSVRGRRDLAGVRGVVISSRRGAVQPEGLTRKTCWLPPNTPIHVRSESSFHCEQLCQRTAGQPLMWTACLGRMRWIATSRVRLAALWTSCGDDSYVDDVPL